MYKVFFNFGLKGCVILILSFYFLLINLNFYLGVGGVLYVRLKVVSYVFSIVLIKNVEEKNFVIVLFKNVVYKLFFCFVVGLFDKD